MGKLFRLLNLATTNQANDQKLVIKSHTFPTHLIGASKPKLLDAIIFIVKRYDPHVGYLNSILFQPVFCNKNCVPKCSCEPGLVRDEVETGSCLSKEECPVPYNCLENELFIIQPIYTEFECDGTPIFKRGGGTVMQ